MAKNGIKEIFKSFIFDGVIMILLGIVMLVWPKQSLDMLCIAVGAIIALAGLIKLIVFFVNKYKDQTATDLLTSLILIMIGVLLIVRRDVFINMFQFVTGIMLVYGSLLMITHAVMIRKTKGVIFILSIVFSILTAALAVVIFINPAAFASFMTQLHGISLIVEGLSMIIVLSRVKKQEIISR